MGVSATVIIAAVAGLFAAISAAFLVLNFFPRQGGPTLRSLMGQDELDRADRVDVRTKLKGTDAATQSDLDKVKELSRKKSKKKKPVTVDELFFRAGVFSDEDKRDFFRLRLIAPIVCSLGMTFSLYSLAGAQFALLGLVLGGLVGMRMPFMMMERRVKMRDQEIMYYLPLVIEQIAIGVSSSLDIGPCLQRVVQMADERDTHNVVTELIRHAQFYVKSGASLEDALNEIGRLSGHTELKHAFMSLSQVAKHGGEITRQLQELADAVAGQRETKIEAKIKKLELEATGPVALVFLGFMMILLIGFGMQIKDAF